MSTPEPAPAAAPVVPPAPPAPPAAKKSSSGWSRVLWGVLAAFTSPEAVKAEKSLAALVLTRVAVLVPSAGFAVDLLVKALGG